MRALIALVSLSTVALTSCVSERSPTGKVAPPVAAAQVPTPLLPTEAQSEPERPNFRFEGIPVQGALLKGRVPSGTVSLRFQDQPVVFDRDGFFIVGLDRDSPAEVQFKARLANGQAVDYPVRVAPGDWRLEYVNVPYRAGISSAAFQERRGRELARIVAARAVNAQSDGWKQDFIWPVTGRQSGYFGAQRVYQGKPGSYHGGADIAVPTGTVFTAPADGIVTLVVSDDFTLEGKLIIIDHGMGLNSAFLHASAILVNEGDRVTQGQPIGQVGATGRATGPHLHWGLKWNEARIDPLLVAGPVPEG